MTELDNDIIDSVKKIHLVRAIEVGEGQPIMKISTDDLIGCAPEVIREIVRAGGNVLTTNVVRPSLEDAYLRLIQQNVFFNA